MIEQFHFLRPEWFYALLPVLVLLVRIGALSAWRSGWNKHIPAHLLTVLLKNNDQKTSFRWLLLAVAWILTVTALAGPTWEKLPQPVFQAQRGQVLVMDMSMSMRATDIKPNRLTRARFEALDMLKQIQDGEIGLVAFAADAFIISPLTPDRRNLELLLPSLAPELMPEQGSNPLSGIQLAHSLLQKAGYVEGDIFLFSDGIDADQLTDIQDFSRSSPYRLSVLAIGTEAGAPISLTSGELLRDRQGNIVVPKVNLGLLKSIADTGGGNFSTLKADTSDIEYLLDKQRIAEKKAEQEELTTTGDKWAEMGPWLLLPVLLIAAYCFRPGILFAIAAIGILPSPQVHAQLWDSLWKNDNQLAQEAFSREDYAAAAVQFNDPKWQASAEYKQQNYEKTVERLQQFDDAISWYNKGNALAHLGELDQAIDAYEQALTRDPDFQDAAFNKEIVEQMKQQQEQNPENNQQQNQDQDNNQDQQQDQDQQSESNEQESSSNQDNSTQSESEQEKQDQQQNQQNQDQNQDSQSSPKPRDSDNQDPSEQSPQQDEQSQQKDNDKNSEQPQQDTQPPQASEQSAGEMSQAQAGDEDNSEEAQAMQRLLKSIQDDPSLLLRNKMQLEYQKRRQTRSSRGVQKQW